MSYVSRAGTINTNISDHLPVYLMKKKHRCSRLATEIQGYKESDLSDFVNDIQSLDRADLSESGDPNTIWRNLLNILWTE